MKKLFYSLFAVAMAAMTFTSCEDVPAPYDLPSESGNGGGETTPIDPTGEGTVDSPYNVAAALAYVKSLEAGVESEKDIYIKGIVADIVDNYDETGNYGNATYYISDDGTNNANTRFYVYRALYLGNKKYTSGDALQEGDEVIICGKVVYYNGTTPETWSGKAYLYSLNGETGGGGDTPTGEAKGSGTLADPFNAVAANQYASSLDAGVVSDHDVYIKGKIASIASGGEFGEQYGNATFYISDDATANGQFYVFHTYYLGNRKWVTGDQQIKVGDEVIICGKVVNYQGNTPETADRKSYIYSLNGKTDPSETPSTDKGTLDNPYTVAEALTAISALADGGYSDSEVYVKGKISSTFTFYSSYSNCNYYISDDGTENNQLYIYAGNDVNNAPFTAAPDYAIGTDIIIYGKFQKFVRNGNVTLEMAKGNYIVSLGGGSSEAGTNGDFESWENGLPTNWVTASTAGNATLSQSSDAHGGSYSVQVSGTSSANKRLGYKEMALKAGEYTLTFYAKAASSTGASVRPGYVQVTDGNVGSYRYGDYVNDLTATAWTEVKHTFTLEADGTYCIVIMNSKTPGGDVLIDDVTLTTGQTTILKSKKR